MTTTSINSKINTKLPQKSILLKSRFESPKNSHKADIEKFSTKENLEIMQSNISTGLSHVNEKYGNNDDDKEHKDTNPFNLDGLDIEDTIYFDPAINEKIKIMDNEFDIEESNFNTFKASIQLPKVTEASQAISRIAQIKLKNKVHTILSTSNSSLYTNKKRQSKLI